MIFLFAFLFNIQLFTIPNPITIFPYYFPSSFPLSLSSSEVTIGLDRTQYTVGEGNGTVTVCVVIASGEFARPATMELSTQDITATGKLSKYIVMKNTKHKLFFSR